MAFAETAHLVTQLDLRGNLAPGLAAARNQLAATERAVNSAGGNLSRFASSGARSIGFLGSAISTALGVGLERAVSAGIGALTSQLRLGLEGAERLQGIQAQTAAALRATGSAAGLTAADIRNLALHFENISAVVDDKVIQSAENLLLTFRNVNKNAFAPTIQAALDINQRLGGGEEGLAGVMLRLGRAMNNPAKGLALLQRSGISLDASTIKQILSLQKQNKLFQAQTILLDAISVRYGGSYAATANTAAGRTAKLRDALDDMRITFASALLPGIERVQTAVTKLFRDPATLTAIQGFGTRIAGFLTPANIDKGIGAVKQAFVTIKGVAGSIPWGTIGTSLQIAGRGAKFLLDAFVSMPSWVQTAVITGWGLNKITGGVLGNIVSSLATGLIKGVLGINAGVVNINAASVVGSGGGSTVITEAAKGSGLIGWLKLGLSLFGVGGAAYGVTQLAQGGVEAGVHATGNRTFGDIISQQTAGRDMGSIIFGNTQAVKANTDAIHALPTEAQIDRQTARNSAAAQNLYNLGTSARARESGPLPGRMLPTLTPEQFLARLRTTAFIGTTDYKSIFERFTTFRGGGRGTDPTGQGFLALVSQLRNPKAPAVMFEIRGHLKELQSLESYYIAHGDTTNALKVQGVINEVRRLIGITMRDDAATRAEHQKVGQAVREHKLVSSAGFRALDAETRRGTATTAQGNRSTSAGLGNVAGEVRRKKLSATANVHVLSQVNVANYLQLSAAAVAYQVNLVRTSSKADRILNII